jgi:hypothetical protein
MLPYCCTAVPQIVIIDLPTGRERTKSIWDGGLHQVSEWGCMIASGKP